MDNPTPWLTAIAAALAICEARLAACDAATPGPWEVLDKLPPSYSDHGYRAIFCARYGKQVYALAHNMRCASGGWALGDDLPFIAAARTDHPAALRRDIAGLRAHRDAEVASIAPTNRYYSCGDEILQVHRAYSLRVFADYGVTVGGGDD